MINDATLSQAGTIYQYLIALRDCFELNNNEILQIETNGDVSIINEVSGKFQKEVKHHFGAKNLSDRDTDFWNTIANWYEEYEHIKHFSHLILSTTANILSSSSFFDWNNLSKNDKLNRMINIGNNKKAHEAIFRKQYLRIFNETYNKQILLNILDKFIITSSQTSLVGISNEFLKFIGHIPAENRDGYIGALLGEILIKVKNPPHKWEVSRADFDKILQVQSAAYVIENAAPLPKEYAMVVVPEKRIKELQQKKFVLAIRDINFDEQIASAVSDYWKADMTVARYFRDDIIYLKSLEQYKDDLSSRLNYRKSTYELKTEKSSSEEKSKTSKLFYLDAMQWNADDFGSIIRNQGFFQRGVIHNIVDETEFTWKVDGEKHEHK